MAQIQPVKVWYQGQEEQVNVFTLYSQFDNLIDNASFKYQLIKDDNNSSTTMVQGDLLINADDYALWDAEIDANSWIYNWAAEQLNLTIIA